MKITKKVLILITALMLTCTIMLSSVCAYADESDSITVTSGDKIVYRICVSPLDVILSGVNLSVTYDTTALKIASENGKNFASMPDLPSGMLNDDLGGTGEIFATYADGIKGTDLKKGITVLEVIFDAISSTETQINYNMKELFDYDINHLDLSVVYSEIELNGTIIKTTNNPINNGNTNDSAQTIGAENNDDNDNTAVGIIIAIVAVVLVGGIVVLFIVRLNKENSKKKPIKKNKK